MPSPTTSQDTVVPEFLFHTVLTVRRRNQELPGPMEPPDIHVLGSHGTVKAAKAFCHGVLPSLGYDPSEFDTYEERPSDLEDEWEHGAGVLVYAVAPSGHEFTVGIDTKLNTGDLRASPTDGSLFLPHGTDHLHYVLQTIIDYNRDGRTLAEVQGAYARRADAIEATRTCLFVGGESAADFEVLEAQYSMETGQDWPYGEDIMVHAVRVTGENYFVAVKTPPAAYLKHRKEKA